MSSRSSFCDWIRCDGGPGVERLLEDVEQPLGYFEMGDGQTVGPGTVNHDVLRAAELENVAEQAGLEGWTTISEETVLEHDPEWIIYPDYEDEPRIAESLEATTAYQQANLLSVDDNAMNQPAANVVSVIVELVQTVHPEAYDHAFDEYYAGEVTDLQDHEDDAGVSDDDLPGFGVTVVLAAFAVLFARYVRS